jgi:hypothetical protein
LRKASISSQSITGNRVCVQEIGGDDTVFSRQLQRE